MKSRTGNSRIAIIGIAAAALVAGSIMASAQNKSRSIGPDDDDDIGGGGGGGRGCIETIIDGDTEITVCRSYYEAQVGSIRCDGSVRYSRGNYRLFRGECNRRSQIFHGGSLNCELSDDRCYWRPSRSARRLGFEPGYVWIR